MGIKSKLKHTISFLLHGEAKPIYANIHYLAPNEHLKGKKIVITGGGRGLGFAMAKKFGDYRRDGFPWQETTVSCHHP